MTLSFPIIASDIMTRDIVTVTADTTLPAAIGLMLQRGVSGVPVLDGIGTLAGFLTEGDLLRRVELGKEVRRSRLLQFLLGPQRTAGISAEAHSTVVGDVMTTVVVTVDASAPISEIVDVMLAKHVKRVPVMMGQKLVGVVNRSDLLRALADRFTVGATDDADDAMVREGVLAALGRHKWGSRGGIDVTVIDVTVINGAVDLGGVIVEESERAAMRVTVQNVPGVTTVRDHVRFMAPV